MGYYRNTGESLQQFFTRIQLDHGTDNLSRINQEYHQLRYAQDPTAQMHRTFKQTIKEFLQLS